jgi:glutathione S-transferase
VHAMKQQNFNLITHVLCPYVQRSIITLEEKNIPYTRTDIDLAKKPAWFEQKSPMGKVPILLVDDRSALFESTIICEYLDEITPGTLHPEDNFEKAFHRAWIEFGSNILTDIARLYNAKKASDFQHLHKGIEEKFRILENKLTVSSFFAGEEFHLIDAVYGPIFRYFEVFDSIVTLNTFDKLPKCRQWRAALKQRVSVQNAVPKYYSKLLIEFLLKRESYLSQLISTEHR